MWFSSCFRCRRLAARDVQLSQRSGFIGGARSSLNGLPVVLAVNDAADVQNAKRWSHFHLSVGLGGSCRCWSHSWIPAPHRRLIFLRFLIKTKNLINKKEEKSRNCKWSRSRDGYHTDGQHSSPGSCCCASVCTHTCVHCLHSQKEQRSSGPRAQVKGHR